MPLAFASSDCIVMVLNDRIESIQSPGWHRKHLLTISFRRVPSYTHVSQTSATILLIVPHTKRKYNPETNLISRFDY